MLNIAIIDDQQQAIDTLNGYITAYGKENEVDLNVHTFKDAMDFLSFGKSCDIVFFDIDMPMIDGLAAAKRLRERDSKCIIIFVTNLAQYAINGYEVEAMDFILKPVNVNIFNHKFKKAVDLALKQQKDSIIIATNGTKVRLDIDNIIYIEVYNHKILWHTVNETYESWDSLVNVCKAFEDKDFSLCSCSQLINLKYVAQVKGNQVFLKYGDKEEQLTITRVKRKSFIDDFTVALKNGNF